MTDSAFVNEADSDAVDAQATDAVRRQATLEELEAEGDVAADYIEELLDICDLDGDIDISTKDGRAYLSVTSAEESNLSLLSTAEAVAALQELTRLAVQSKSGRFSRVILDVGGSREARQKELAVLVERAVAKLDSGDARVALAPMSSYERKLIHDIAAEHGLQSASEGEGAGRHPILFR